MSAESTIEKKQSKGCLGQLVFLYIIILALSFLFTRKADELIEDRPLKGLIYNKDYAKRIQDSYTDPKARNYKASRKQEIKSWKAEGVNTKKSLKEYLKKNANLAEVRTEVLAEELFYDGRMERGEYDGYGFTLIPNRLLFLQTSYTLRDCVPDFPSEEVHICIKYLAYERSFLKFRRAKLLSINSVSIKSDLRDDVDLGSVVRRHVNNVDPSLIGTTPFPEQLEIPFLFLPRNLEGIMKEEFSPVEIAMHGKRIEDKLEAIKKIDNDEHLSTIAVKAYREFKSNEVEIIIGAVFKEAINDDVLWNVLKAINFSKSKKDFELYAMVIDAILNRTLINNQTILAQTFRFHLPSDYQDPERVNEEFADALFNRITSNSELEAIVFDKTVPDEFRAAALIRLNSEEVFLWDVLESISINHFKLHTMVLDTISNRKIIENQEKLARAFRLHFPATSRHRHQDGYEELEEKLFEKIKSKNELEEIVFDKKVPDKFRAEALIQLNSEEVFLWDVLEAISINNVKLYTTVIDAILNRNVIKNQEKLARAFRYHQDGNQEFADALFNRITSKKELEAIVFDEYIPYEFQQKSLKLLNNEEVCVKFFKIHQGSTRHELCAAKYISQDTFKEMVQNGILSALLYIDDQKYMSKCVLLGPTSKADFIFKHGLIVDSDMAKDIFQRSTSWKVRRDCIKLIDDQKFLFKVINSKDERYEVKATAAASLSEPEFLHRTALESDSYVVVIKAIPKIKDQEVLRTIIFSQKNSHSNDSVKEAALLGITDQNILFECAKMKTGWDYGWTAAIIKLSAQDKLIKLAKPDSGINESGRALAISQINDIKALRSLRDDENDTKCLNAIKNQLNKLEL